VCFLCPFFRASNSSDDQRGSLLHRYQVPLDRSRREEREHPTSSRPAGATLGGKRSGRICEAPNRRGAAWGVPWFGGDLPRLRRHELAVRGLRASRLGVVEGRHCPRYGRASPFVNGRRDRLATASRWTASRRRSRSAGLRLVPSSAVSDLSFPWAAVEMREPAEEGSLGYAGSASAPKSLNCSRA